MITDWAPDNLVVEVRAADAAAQAARAVPGVVRLQPGVLGLLAQFAAQAFEQATGQGLPDIAGVQARLREGPDSEDPENGRVIEIEVQIVVGGGYHAPNVGAAVAYAAAAAVVSSVAAVTVVPVLRVHIVEIDLYGPCPPHRHDRTAGAVHGSSGPTSRRSRPGL